MKINESLQLPEDFILDITELAGSGNTACLIAIEHYRQFLNSENPIVRQISQAMVGNLTEYYNISHPGSMNFELALPHLSEMANFMDSKNTPQMDIESTARIKSFYSTYEKLLLECSELLEKKDSIPTSGLAYDLIATRDVLYPRYQLRLEPHNFYKHVYGLILEYMEHIDNLSKIDPRYGFEEIPEQKRIKLQRPKRLNFVPDEDYTIPDIDFTDFALEFKGIPLIYKYLADLSPKISATDIRRDIEIIQSSQDFEQLGELPLIQALRNQLRKESLVCFRNELEKDVLSDMPNNPTMIKEYKERSAEDFIYIYKQRLSPPHRDFIRIVEYIDSSIAGGGYDFYLNFGELVKEGPVSETIISGLLDSQLSRQEHFLNNRIKLLANTDLGSFNRNLEEASRINYFSRCAKDYMRNPKETGYQSFHLIVHTPFGSYEKQFRTAAQNDFAEHGHASHSASYKPYEKENFHRLKIFQPLMPARDEKSDIITPIKLEPLDFESSVRAYYHQPFLFFSGGLSLSEFKAAHPDDFDEAMLSLSESNATEGMLDRISRAFSFLKNFDFLKAFANRKSYETQHSVQIGKLMQNDDTPHRNSLENTENKSGISKKDIVKNYEDR